MGDAPFASRRSPAGDPQFKLLMVKSVQCIAATVILLLAASTQAQNGKFLRAGAGKVANEYIVAFDDDVLPDEVPELARQLAAAHGGRADKAWSHAFKGFFVVMTEARAQALSRSPRVKYVEENANWYLSATQQTNIDPAACDPTAGTCPAVVDNRLWHLDRLDQNLAPPTNTCANCSDGTGITVYVVDSGVNKYHHEFGPSGARVKPGFNATPDLMPADDPCMGFAIPPGDQYFAVESALYRSEWEGGGHGTGVASVLGGKRVGVAKNVTIVPIKVLRCDRWSARSRRSSQYYAKNETMFKSYNGSAYPIFRALNSGTTASSVPSSWPINTGDTIQDGGVLWEVIDTQSGSATDMLLSGLDWILSPANTGPKSQAVVTLSTYALASEASAVNDTIRNLLAHNLTVVASANNQNGNACDTSPALLSQNNPNASLAGDVITVGGSMILNVPWGIDISDVSGGGATPADGGGKGLEPAYNPTKAVRDGRWICGAGDSSVCSNTTPEQTVPPGGSYASFQGGSNGGPCVTLFAPSKNVFVASPTSASGYRDARVYRGNASGTSWSAPIVAGYAARILQNNPTFTPQQVRAVLLANSVSTLDAATLHPKTSSGTLISGTPNKLLRLGDVNITSQPASVTASAPTPVSVTASGTSTVSYQWFEVNSDYGYEYPYGAHSSTSIGGANSATFMAPVSPTAKGYWVRVSNSCGSADSNIAVVTPCAKPAFSSVTSSTTILLGATITISASATAAGSSFQWYEGPEGNVSSPIGTGSAVNVTPGWSTRYWVRATNSCGFTDSAAVNVAVTTPTAFYTVAPCRIVDTRGGGALANLETRDIQVTGLCGIAAGARAVAANIVGLNPPTTGFLAFRPAGTNWAYNSTMNYRLARTRANNAILTLSSSGKTTVYNNGGILDLIIDVSGYFK